MSKNRKAFKKAETADQPTDDERQKAKQLTKLSKNDLPSFTAHIRAALVMHSGVVTKASRELGIHVRQLWRVIKKYPAVLEDTGHRENKALQGIVKHQQEKLDT